MNEDNDRSELELASNPNKALHRVNDQILEEYLYSQEPLALPLTTEGKGIHEVAVVSFRVSAGIEPGKWLIRSSEDEYFLFKRQGPQWVVYQNELLRQAKEK